MYNITHDDYAFAERSDQEQWVIHLKRGQYEDTYYCYDRVQIVPPEGGWPEDDSDHIGTLRFTYGIIESPLDMEVLREDEDFNNYIGAVLQHIIEDSFDKGDYKIGGDNGESGNDNTEESNQ